MWPAQECHRSFFFKIEKIERNADQKINKYIYFLDFWENSTSSRAPLLKVTPICCFATFLARADPRGSCTIPSVVGKRLQLITHTSLVQVTLFFSTSALVNNLVGSRATVGHSSSLLSQRKSHRNCFWFSLFLSAFQTVFFKTPCLVPSNYKQSLSRLPVQFHRISINLFQTLAFLSF